MEFRSFSLRERERENRLFAFCKGALRGRSEWRGSALSGTHNHIGIFFLVHKMALIRVVLCHSFHFCFLSTFFFFFCLKFPVEWFGCDKEVYGWHCVGVVGTHNSTNSSGKS